MIGVAVLLAASIVAAAAMTAVAVFSLRPRSAIEQAFEDARADSEWPTPDELLDAFSADVDGRSEAELNRLAGKFSDFNRRLDQMKRQASRGER